ncbi:MAG: aldehyde dehydrogenase (NADP(+)) [Micromonosporaceae bacterium]|nr:aldehyde dehydrogenase (NADP(+)) [Micromonosporaceae bacterium]
MSYDQGHNPRTGQPVGEPVPHTDGAGLDQICRAAAAAAPPLAAPAPPARAAVLRAGAAALRAEQDALVSLADEETALGTARLRSEVVRTCVQLEMFADAVLEGSIFEVVIDLPDPDAQPAPRPDLRRMLVPLGPVAVFSASNFPFAFSVAGGDTASALAAGCPVVVKAHPSHPGLSQLTGRVVAGALAKAGAPEGVFAVVYGTDAGRALVQHPAITAAGFTGSLQGGRALFDLANSRPDPIPFYGELGALNPIVVSQGALAQRADEIVSGFVGSYTLGSGQFCTKPGLLFLPSAHGLDGRLADAVAACSVGPLLNARIQEAFQRTTASFARVQGVRQVVPAAAAKPDSAGYGVAPALLAVPADQLVAHPELLEEAFGPASLLVEYASTEELLAALERVPGSLAAGLHVDPATEPELTATLLERLSARAGRVVFGGWPTGVAVTWAMHHGGPWPATTDPLHTSVGVTAVRRFQRPVVYQNVPEYALPPALQDANPLGIPRRVNGRVTSAPITS